MTEWFFELSRSINLEELKPEWNDNCYVKCIKW